MICKTFPQLGQLGAFNDASQPTPNHVIWTTMSLNLLSSFHLSVPYYAKKIRLL